MFKLYRAFAHFVIAGTSSLAACSVWAASQQPDLLALPWLQIALAGVISLWGGVGRTAVRALEAAQLARAVPPVDDGFHLGRELRTDLVLSSGIGLVVYAVGAHQGWDTWLLAPALWLGGYMGTKLVNVLIEKALKFLSTFGVKP